MILYNLELKRFICEDPIKDGLNWYSYCNGNPVGYVDTSWLELKIAGSLKEHKRLLYLSKSKNKKYRPTLVKSSV